MTERSTVTVQRDVPFHEAHGETLALDVYDGAGSGRKPVAVLVHGGGFTDGERSEFDRYAADLAAEGYLAVTPQYRLAPDHTFPAALVDVKAAVEWCRSEAEAYGVDTQRVVGVGHGAGANLVALAAATADDPALEPALYPGVSSALSAVVGYAGIYDFRAFAEAGRGDAADRYAPYLGGGPEERPEAYDLASPATQASMSMPPTLLLHGEDDAVVPPAQSELLARTLDPVTTVTYEPVSGGHDFPFDEAGYEDAYERTVAFLGRHAGADHTSDDRQRPSPDGPGSREPPGGGPTDSRF